MKTKEILKRARQQLDQYNAYLTAAVNGEITTDIPRENLERHEKEFKKVYQPPKVS